LFLRLPPFTSEAAFWKHELSLDPCNPLGLEHLSNRAAAEGHIRQTLAHVDAMLSNECIAVTQAHGPLAQRVQARRMELRAALTPDGDVEGLQGWYEKLSRGYPQAVTQRPQRAAALAMLAARLGHDAPATKLAASALSGDLTTLAAPANLVLTLARLGSTRQARELLQRLANAEPSPLIDRGTARDLETRLQRASEMVAEARRRDPHSRLELLASSQGELGAYLRALRILQPAYRAAPQASTRVLYVQLLVMARLEDSALRELNKSETPERSRQIVEAIRETLPPALALLQSVPHDRGP
jgi:tetratricopeptide (TPR) repeat protein